MKLDSTKRGVSSQGGGGGKVDQDIWPNDPKWIESLCSSSTTCIWSLKVIGQKLYPAPGPQGFIQKVLKLTLAFELATKYQYDPSSHDLQLACKVCKCLD